MDQLSPDVAGQPFGHCRRRTERVARGVDPIASNAPGGGASHFNAVDSGSDAAEDGDAQRPAELRAGFREKARYNGSGSITAAGSYTCN